MAVIQYTGLVTQLRGSIAGTTFSKTKQGFSAYKKGLPRKQKSSAQNAINAGFAANANLWRTLDSTARANWAAMAAAVQIYSRIGELVNISAYNMYQLISALINPTGSGTALAADGSTDPPYQFSVELISLEFESTPVGWIISDISIDVTTITNQTTACHIVFWISQPELSEESAARDNWYRLKIDTLDGNIGSDETENFTFSNVQLPPGFKVIPGYFYRVKAQMVQVNSKVFTLGVISPPTVATELPPYEMPEFSYDQTEIQNNWTSVSTSLTSLSVFFLSDPTGQQSQDFELELRMRGIVYGSPVFSPTMNALIPVNWTNTSTETDNANFGFGGGNTSTIIAELNDLGIDYGEFLGQPWLMLTIRLYNPEQNTYSPSQDILVRYWDY